MSNPTILEIVPGSPAAVAGLQTGDELLAVNGVRPSDVIEYQQLVDDPDVTLQLRRAAHDWHVDISKQPGAPLGLRLSASIFDRVQTCDNHCSFCFIYQLPPGMRKSLYLKDDDYRLSFLYGNFTTLTRFTELDLVRVVEDRLGPLYVSIHTTDPDVRAGMLRNPRGATSLRWLRSLLQHDVVVHGQIVLMPTVNGGDVLDRTCAEIVTRYPELASVGIVPLGISRFNREPSLVPHDRATAQRDLAIVERWRNVANDHLGKHLFHASDELYLMADAAFPDAEGYEDFAQHENGIGMARALYDEIERLQHGGAGSGPLITGEWRSIPAAPAEGYRAPRSEGGSPSSVSGPVVMITGEYGRRVLEPVAGRLAALAERPVRLLEVPNKFFGGNVAVAGLLVGEDVARALAADDAPAGLYLLPDIALVGDTFLDGMPFAAVAASASAPVRTVEATAAGFLAGAAA